MNQIIVNLRESERRAAVLQNGEIVRLHIDQPEQQSLIGNIYLGIVEKVVPSMNAAFVHMGSGKKGYLHISQVPAYLAATPEEQQAKPIGHYIYQGEKILVQVTKDETDSKIYRLTANIEFGNENLVYMPHGAYLAVSKKMDESNRLKWRKWGREVTKGNEGMVIRTSAEFTKEEILFEELEKLRNQFESLQKQSLRVKAPALIFKQDSFSNLIGTWQNAYQIDEIIVDEKDQLREIEKKVGENTVNVQFYNGKENIFTHFQIEEKLEKLSKKIAWLPNGANIVIEEAEAFTIIDVNSGKADSKQQKEAAIKEVNSLAAVEIAHQVQARNITGIILIDFINMKNEQNKHEILDILKNQFRNDPNRTTIYGYTALGIVEMSRKRTTPSLKQIKEEQCPVCHGKGSIESPASIAFKLERELWEYRNSDYEEMIIEATDEVIQYFTGESERQRKNLEELLHLKIKFDKIDFHRPHYHIKRLS